MAGWSWWCEFRSVRLGSTNRFRILQYSFSFSLIYIYMYNSLKLFSIFNELASLSSVEEMNDLIFRKQAILTILQLTIHSLLILSKFPRSRTAFYEKLFKSCRNELSSTTNDTDDKKRFCSGLNWNRKPLDAIEIPSYVENERNRAAINAYALP